MVLKFEALDFVFSKVALRKADRLSLIDVPA
jgi:hypothetical protein